MTADTSPSERAVKRAEAKQIEPGEEEGGRKLVKSIQGDGVHGGPRRGEHRHHQLRQAQGGAEHQGGREGDEPQAAAEDLLELVMVGRPALKLITAPPPWRNPYRGR